ncbi:MAG TPA: hypothetical protein VFZ17_10770 [Acidimicrobiia bacterium]|nr:hypothetical protein [Acidimicrobiia bacterium]
MSKDLERELAERAVRQHGIFTLADVRQVGLAPSWHRNRLVAGRIVVVRDLAYRFAGAPLDWRGEVLAAAWAGGSRGRASHRSSAALFGLKGGCTDTIEITCKRWRRARYDDLVIHETKAFDPVDATEVDGIPCTTVARTLLDLGAVLSSAQVEYALDDALRRNLVTLDELRALLRRVGRRGRNGTGVMRKLLETRTPGRPAESVPERRMVRMLARLGLPEPILQCEVWHEGRFVARVDAAYPQWQIAIEYESYEFHGTAAVDRDAARTNALRRAGWSYVPVTNADVKAGCVDVAATIRAIRDDLFRSGFGVADA